MTTIAAVQGPGWAAVAWDSRVTEGERAFTLPKSSGKISKNGPYLLGAAGDMRAINLLAHTFKPMKPPATASDEDLDTFMSMRFIKDLKKCFDDAEYGEKGQHDSAIIAIVHGRIYEIGMNYDWCHDSAGLYAVGTGAKYALGALDVQLRGKKLTQAAAKEALSSALAAACTYDPNSSPPINLLVQSR